MSFDIKTGNGPQADFRLPIFDRRTGAEEILTVPGVDRDGQAYMTRESLLGALGVNDQLEPPEGSDRPEISFKCGLVIRPRDQVVTIGDREIPRPLTHQEFSLLHYMARKPGQLTPEERILEEVWGTGFISPSTVRTYVFRIRAKLDAQPSRNSSEGGPNQGVVVRRRSVGVGIGERVWSPEQLVFPDYPQAS